MNPIINIDWMSGRGSEPKSVGKALRKALGHETFKFDVESRKDGRSQLMNPRRLRIFSYLWKMPCSHIRQIVSDILFFQLFQNV